MKGLISDECYQRYNTPEKGNPCNLEVFCIYSNCPDCDHANKTDVAGMWIGWLNSFPIVEVECGNPQCQQQYIFQVDGVRFELQYYKKPERKVEPRENGHGEADPPIPLPDK